MDPKIILRKLLERLEPEVGEVKASDFGAWGEDGLAAQRERSKAGWFSLATAVLDARAALASGDPERIAAAALLCPTFERQGRQQAVRHAAAIKRQNGGKQRGAAQTADATARWAPYIAAYHDLVGRGKPPSTARRIVADAWGRDHPHDEPPSERTFRHWLR